MGTSNLFYTIPYGAYAPIGSNILINNLVILKWNAELKSLTANRKLQLVCWCLQPPSKIKYPYNIQMIKLPIVVFNLAAILATKMRKYGKILDKI